LRAICVGEAGAIGLNTFLATNTNTPTIAVCIGGALPVGKYSNGIASIVPIGTIHAGLAKWCAILGSLLGIIEETNHIAWAIGQDI